MSQRISERPCYVCSKPLGESTFTFTSRGGVHFGCFADEVRSKRPAQLSEETLSALLDSLNDKLNGIVRFKERLGKAADSEASSLIQQIERDEERHAAELTKLIERLAGK